MAKAKLDVTMKTDVYTFLDALRESGVTNMFGAAPYVQEEFGFKLQVAQNWLSSWMRDFGKS